MNKIKQVLLKNNQTFYSNQKIVVMFNISRGRLWPKCVFIVSHFKSWWNGKVMLHTESLSSDIVDDVMVLHAI